MAKGVVATMDTLGYLSEPTVKADRAIAYWFANRIDQCIILREVHSFQYVVASHQDDKGSEERFLAAVKTNLTDYLLQIFDGATVDTRAIKENEDSKMFTLAISGEFYQDGQTYELNHSVIVNGKTYELVERGRRVNAR